MYVITKITKKKIPCLFLWAGVFSLMCVFSFQTGNAQVIQYDFNEPTDRGFTTENYGDGPNEWARDTVLPIGTDAPSSTHAPPMGWATNPQGEPECAALNSDGEYGLLTPEYIATSSSIDFDFYEYVAMDGVASCLYDRTWLEYRINGGGWIQIWQDCMERQPWQLNQNTVSGLSAGDTVQFQFRFLKNDGFCGGTFHRAGWYIDSLEVTNANGIPLQYVDAYAYDKEDGSVLAGINDAEVLGVNIELDGYAGDPKEISDLYFSLGSTTDPLDIDAAHLYYADEEGDFSTSEQFGSTVPSPSGQIHFNDIDSIAESTQLWIAFDVATGATMNNELDAEFDSLVVEGNMEYPSTTSLPGTREILTALSGTYNVGTGEDFETITEAVNELNSVGIDDDVQFVLTDANYDAAETFPITVEDFNNLNDDTVTFEPAAGVEPTIEGDTVAVFHLEAGVSNIHFDGSNDGSDSQDLTINNTTSASNSAVFWLESDGTNGVQHVALENAILDGSDWDGENTTGIFVGADVTNLQKAGFGDDFDNPEEGAGHSDITIGNNHIYNAHNGIYAAGTDGSLIDNIHITDNEIGHDDDATRIGWYGIALTNADNAVVNRNHVHNLFQTDNESVRGIYFMGEVINSEVMANKIHNLESNDSFDSGQGIWLTDDAANVVIANNVIYDLRAGDSFSNSEDNNAFGIVLEGSSSGIELIHNTILNVTPSIQDNDDVGGILLQGSVTGITMLNNIIEVSIPGNPNFAVYADDLDSNDFDAIDHNIYQSDDYVGVLDGTNHTDLPSWQMDSGDDLNSIEADPLLLNIPEDMRPLSSSPAINAGTSTNISSDFEGEPRDPADPFIGAYETTPPFNDAGITNIGAFCTGLNNLNVEVTNFAQDTLTEITLNWSVDGVDQVDTTYTSLSVAPLETKVLSLGEFNFTGAHDIVVATSQPNGNPDEGPSNDTLSVESQGSALVGVYEIGGPSPDFNTLTEAVDAINDVGICDNTTFELHDAEYSSSEAFPLTFEGYNTVGEDTLTITPASGVESVIESSNYSVMNFEDVQNVIIEGIHFLSDDANHIIELHSSDVFVLENNMIEGGSGETEDGILIDEGSDIHLLNNEVHNLISAQPNYGIRLVDVSNSVVHGNLIHGIESSVDYDERPRGIGVLGSSQNVEISSNKIHDMECYDSFCGSVGIYIRNNAENIDVFNNLIYDLRDGGTTSGTDYWNSFGIWVGDNAQNLSFVHNTIYNSTATGTQVTGGIWLESNATDLTFLNNIIQIDLPELDAYAIYANDQDSTDFIAIDHNIYHSSGELGYLDGNDQNDLSDWQAVTGEDVNSIEDDPEFFIVNQDFRPFPSSPAVGNGTSVTGIDEDIDGESRDPSSPWIGAYETLPPANDAGVTEISGFCSGLSQVSVEIQNFGIDSLESVTIEWKLDGTVQNDTTYSGLELAINETTLLEIGEANFSSSGNYDITAYTMNPNGQTDENPQNDTLSVSDRGTGLEGTYAIGGSSPDFNSISEATDELNNIGICDQVTFEFYEDTIDVNSGESFPIQIGGYQNVNDDTLTIRPASGVNTIIEADADAVFHLTEALNVVIDGSNDGTDSQDLKINNTTASENSAVIWMQSSSSAGIENVTIENTMLDGSDWDGENTTGIFIGDDVTNLQKAGFGDDFDNPEEGAGFSNLTISNNHIYNAHNGVYAAGTDGSLIDNINIINNEIGNDEDTARIGWYGVVLNNAENSTISGNHIHNLLQTDDESTRGIFLLGEVIDSEISSNEIHNLATDDTFDSGQGIWLKDDASNIDIFNNVIYDLRANESTSATESNNPFGIVLQDNSSDINIYYNTIANTTPSQSGNDVGAILLEDDVTNLAILNNIFMTTLEGQDNFAVYADDLEESDFVQIDHNIYYSNGALGLLDGNTYSNISAWQSATNDDNNSYDGNPQFVDEQSDFGISNALSPAIMNGTPVSGIDIDFAGNTRDANEPFIGAIEEMAGFDNDLGVTDILQPTSQDICGTEGMNVEVQIGNYGTNPQSNFDVSVVILRDSVVEDTFTTAYSGTLGMGEIDSLFISNFDGTAGGDFQFVAYTQLSNDEDHSNDTSYLEHEIQIIPDVPTVNNPEQIVCGEIVSTEFSASTNIGEIYWYDSIGADPIHTGTSFNVDSIHSYKEFYLKGATASSFSGGLPSNTTGGGFTTGNETGLEFDANVSFMLNTVTIYPEGTGDLNIYLDDGSGNILESHTESISGASGNPHVVELNFEVPAANGLRLYTDNSNDLDDLYRSDIGPGFPFASDNNEFVITDGFSADRYYYFYDWQATVPGCESDYDTVSVQPSYVEFEMLEGEPFAGSFNDGTSSNPDMSCPEDTLTYEFTSPADYDNEDYNSHWEVTEATVINEDSVQAMNVEYNSPSAGNNGTLMFYPDESEGDSIFTAIITVHSIESGCEYTVARQIYIDDLPDVDFSFNEVCDGKEINFENEAESSSPISYNWEFGDGHVTATENPTHIFDSAGSYDVTLTAKTVLGNCISSTTQTVDVHPYPEADFTSEDVCYGNEVQFDNLTSIPAGNIDEYIWTFGDGDSSNLENPSHHFADTGDFEVTLRAISEEGCESVVTDTVTIYPLPVSDFTASNECDGDSIHFNNESHLGDSFEWDFGDGITSTEENPSHLYDEAGEYEVELVTESADGCTDTSGKMIEVYPNPEASFTFEDVCYGDSVAFENESSGADHYAWMHEGDTISTHEHFNHAFDATGLYEVMLVAETADGCVDYATDTVEIFEIPDANFEMTADEESGEVIFEPEDTELAGYDWDFGDGNTSTEVSPDHTYDVAGSYSISLQVETAEGCVNSSTDSVDITVSLANIEEELDIEVNAYPNPFSDQATITYTLDEQMEVSGSLYDMQGRKIMDLADNELTERGEHKIEIDAVELELAHSTYIVRMEFDGKPATLYLQFIE